MPIDGDELKGYTWRSIVVALGLGILMVFSISVYSKPSSNNLSSFFNSFGSGILIAGASLTAGGILGFIFGIPSVSQINGARIKYNDNLGQISDWLTKIIVGVGLTQLTKIPAFILRVGDTLKYSFEANEWGRNAALSITGYFFLLGFLMLYFWARTDYSTILDDIDRQLNRKLQQAIKEKSDILNDLQERIQSITKDSTSTSTGRSESEDDIEGKD